MHPLIEDLVFSYIETEHITKLYNHSVSYDDISGNGARTHMTHKVWSLLSKRLLPWVFDDVENEKQELSPAKKWAKKHGHKEKYKKKQSK